MTKTRHLLMMQLALTLLFILLLANPIDVSAQDWDTVTPVPSSTLIPTNTLTPTPTQTSTATPFPPGWRTATPLPQQTIPNPNPAQRVMIITLDGLRPDAIRRDTMPNLVLLAEGGAATYEAQTTFPPWTIPVHTSMLTGLSPEKHQVDWNGFRDDFISESTILTTVHDAGYKTGMVVGNNKFRQFKEFELVDYAFMTFGDRDVVQRAVEFLDEGYEFLFVHFPNPDFFGHENGWMSDTYLLELRNTDAQLGRLLFTLERLGIQDSTLVIVTSDHGGEGIGHSDEVPSIMTVPWIIAGPGVIPETELGEVSIRSTAGTALWALGLPVGGDMARPIYEAFGITDFEEE